MSREVQLGYVRVPRRPAFVVRELLASPKVTWVGKEFARYGGTREEAIASAELEWAQTAEWNGWSNPVIWATDSTDAHNPMTFSQLAYLIETDSLALGDLNIFIRPQFLDAFVISRYAGGWKLRRPSGVLWSAFRWDDAEAAIDRTAG